MPAKIQMFSFKLEPHVQFSNVQFQTDYFEILFVSCRIRRRKDDLRSAGRMVRCRRKDSTGPSVRRLRRLGHRLRTQEPVLASVQAYSIVRIVTGFTQSMIYQCSYIADSELNLSAVGIVNVFRKLVVSLAYALQKRFKFQMFSFKCSV